ncbi:MAG: exodeoxyribonuclease VII small subunit [Deltaproteobacteria bacterium]|nr:MAG: exodeoxyribonuclease VII small subunit [Deltaproteobacteria bacterium]HEX16161.1 exodeoxyribonuclease VII small subunit [Deltaproteobacteria bacterium]
MEERTFEEAMKELEGIVKRLEGGDLPLEEALKLFERGVGLVRFCRDKLEEAKKKVEILVKEGSNLVPKPFEEEGPGF